MILVVDDDPSIPALCRRYLARMGYEAVCAGGLGEARERLRGMERLDLLITDMRLPDGLGIEVIESCLQRFPASRALVMSGEAVPEAARERLKDLGLEEGGILLKPFTAVAFEAVVRGLIASSSARKTTGGDRP